jgi:hypothetical protein
MDSTLLENREPRPFVHVSDVPAAMLFAEPGALEGKSPWVGVACNGAQNSTRGMLPILAFPSGRGGEIGRRTGLKIPGPQGRVGSIPTPGTILLTFGHSV